MLTQNSVVSRFERNRLSQFFVQDGRKIEVPPPTWPGLPNSADITPELCDAQFRVFDDRNRFAETGGFDALNEALTIPMVLVMSIWDDVCGTNLQPGMRPVLTCLDSTTPTCSGSTPATRPRRPASPVATVARARPPLVSLPRSRLSTPMRTLLPPLHLQKIPVLTIVQSGRLVQHPLRPHRLDRQRLSYHGSKSAPALLVLFGAPVGGYGAFLCSSIFLFVLLHIEIVYRMHAYKVETMIKSH
jgi:hypothetical protein